MNPPSLLRYFNTVLMRLSLASGFAGSVYMNTNLVVPQAACPASANRSLSFVDSTLLVIACQAPGMRHLYSQNPWHSMYYRSATYNMHFTSTIVVCKTMVFVFEHQAMLLDSVCIWCNMHSWVAANTVDDIMQYTCAIANLTSCD